MPDLYVDVDTAVVVPVNILPLCDDTDFKTIETAVVYNSAGMALQWNFVTAAGATSCVAVTPTTAGVYDWSEPLADVGMYAIEIPASGGASANNDTEGCGWFTGKATGVLPWRGPTIHFASALINDARDGTDAQQVHAVEITNGLITAAAIADGAIDAATFAAGAVNAAAVAADMLAAVADKWAGRNVAGGSDGGRTNAQALASQRNKVTAIASSATAGTMTVYATDDVTPLWTAAITFDATTGMITVIDPA